MAPEVPQEGGSELQAPSGRRWKAAADALLTALMLVATVMVIVLAGQRLAGGVPPVAGTDRGRDDLPVEPLPLRGSPTKGSPSAPVSLIVYSDFQCPFCAKFAVDVLPEVERRFVDAGRVAVVFRHLPLESMHPLARGAAVAAECANSQGKFWPLHDRMFRSPTALGPIDLVAYADEVGLDRSRFQACIREPSEVVEADLAEAARLGFNATPIVLLGKTLQDGTVGVVRRFTGLPPLVGLVEAISELLKE